MSAPGDLQALRETLQNLPSDREALERVASSGLAHPRLPRIDGAERAPTGQAKCRSCREPIARDSWRIRLAFYEEGRFSPGGFVHLDCRTAYFDTDDVLDRLLHFSSNLSDSDRDALSHACAAGPAAPEAPQSSA